MDDLVTIWIGRQVVLNQRPVSVTSEQHRRRRQRDRRRRQRRLPGDRFVVDRSAAHQLFIEIAQRHKIRICESLVFTSFIRNLQTIIVTTH